MSAFKSVQEAVDDYTKSVLFDLSEPQLLESLDIFLSGVMAGISVTCGCKNPMQACKDVMDWSQAVSEKKQILKRKEVEKN